MTTRPRKRSGRQGVNPGDDLQCKAFAAKSGKQCQRTSVRDGLCQSHLAAGTKRPTIATDGPTTIDDLIAFTGKNLVLASKAQRYADVARLATIQLEALRGQGGVLDESRLDSMSAEELRAELEAAKAAV